MFHDYIKKFRYEVDIYSKNLYVQKRIYHEEHEVQFHQFLIFMTKSFYGSSSALHEPAIVWTV